jgi:hypothetical protein
VLGGDDPHPGYLQGPSVSAFSEADGLLNH